MADQAGDQVLNKSGDQLSKFEKNEVSPMTEISKEFLRDENWAEVFRDAMNALNGFDKGIVEKANLIEPKSRDLHRLVRLCVPLLEIGLSVDQVPPDGLLLASIFLWSEAWRPMDNILDGDGSRIENLAAYTQAYCRASRFQLQHFGLGNGEKEICSKALENIWFEQNEIGRSKFEQIHVRAAVLESTLISHNPYSDRTLDIYRNFIGLFGLAHDFLDIGRDLATGQKTLVVAKLAEM